MKHTALMAAALLVVTLPAMAQEADALPMDSHDDMMGHGSVAATMGGDMADVSSTVETHVKTTLGGTMDQATGMGVLTTSSTEVTTSVTTEVTPHAEETHAEEGHADGHGAH